eukprot:CAMPEP_0170565550 /NCGR_PEP_ID=MMETSP0211-20121228/79259_1 /TAXON_ID=311385 /ORGANISM="Pseudokeronopsis sp., Strain OXSARD2" /LENGTH=77 /DNA_ID=CAMNT_0010886455 /DNA_START=854 /DNA_END=1087 /DNA_ORIENTATION=-
MEKGRDLKTLSLSDGHSMKILENCIAMGIPVLLENLQESFNPAIESLLQKQILGESTNGFKIYMTTKLSNPHYHPEV